MDITEQRNDDLPMFVPIVWRIDPEHGLVPVFMTLPPPDGATEVWVGEDGFPYTKVLVFGTAYKVRLMPVIQQPTQKIITKPN